MKLRTSFVLCLLILSLVSNARAQESLERTIADLQKQIQLREGIDRDVKTPSDLRVVNRRVLEAKRAQLLSVVRVRIAELHRYLDTLGTAVTTEEKVNAESSLSALVFLRDRLAGSKAARPAASRSIGTNLSRPRAVGGRETPGVTFANGEPRMSIAEPAETTRPFITLDPAIQGDNTIKGSSIATINEILVEIRPKESIGGIADSRYSHSTRRVTQPTVYRVTRFSPPGWTNESWRFSVRLSRPLTGDEEIRALPNGQLVAATSWSYVSPSPKKDRDESVSEGWRVSTTKLTLSAASETNPVAIRRVPSPNPQLPSRHSGRNRPLGAVKGAFNAQDAGEHDALYEDVKKPSAISQIFKRRSGGQESLRIDTPLSNSESIVIPAALEVTNATAVAVYGSKSPINKCVVTTTRTDLPPEKNPLETFVGIISKAAGAIHALDKAASPPPLVSTFSALCGPVAARVIPADPEAYQIEAQLTTIRQNLKGSYESIYSHPNDLPAAPVSARRKYENLAKEIGDFASCARGLCSNEMTFVNEKDRLKNSVETLLENPLPLPTSSELQLTTLKTSLGKRYATQTAGDFAWINSVNAELDCYQRAFELIKQVRDRLLVARTELQTVSDILETIAETEVFRYEKVIPVDRNAKVLGKVACSNLITKQPAAEIPFTVIYQNVPRATVSAGVLVSTLDRRQVTTQPIRTGTAPDGTPTFKTVFAETDRSDYQLVPFSFFNYYLSGTRRMNLNLTGGVGVNPNNGKTQIEFFLGGSVGFKNVYVHFGEHIGRWQEPAGQFQLGETVPDKFPGLPIERRYSWKPAYGLSYRLPVN